ncbi:MAG: hypothetical protein HY908_30770 [Myxococcales bacterium]|nr:hypothetical protein [Myxococcales bacterium]
MFHIRTTRTLVTLALVSPFALAALACGKKGADGIAECDAYFKTIEGCANADEKSTLQMAANLEKDGWKHLDREKVKEACVERGKYAKDRCDVGPEGIPDCEEYFKLTENCKTESQKNNAKQFKEQWKSRPKSTLKDTCAKSLEMAKKFCQ